MKNKFTLNILIVFLYSALTVYTNSDEFIFDTSEIDILENGDVIEATDGTVMTVNGDIKIDAKKFYYNKKELLLDASGEVEVDDLKNKVLIKSEYISYNNKSRTISSNENSIIEDDFGNIFLLENFIYTLDDELIKLGKSKVIDYEKNTYNLDKAFINLKSKKLLGKDISIDFSNKSFQKDNEPRLKGNSIVSDGNSSIISKGVFTTCKKNDSCPPWQLSAKKITHNKKKKIIYYKDAWLKVYDTPVFYFPKFFHPDPTVKRQSGFLMPTVMSSSSFGNSFNTPYYHVLDVNKDATINPRFYNKNKLLLQTEFREVNKNSSKDFDFSFLTEEDKPFKSHFFSSIKKTINFFNFENSNILLKLEHTSNDDYLKTYKLESPLIENDTLMHSYLELNAFSDDLSLTSSLEVYEDLSKPDSDRYEFIYPNYNLLKDFNNITNVNGRFSVNSYGYAKTHNTNVGERIIVNDLIFNSNPKIFKSGLKNSYTYLLKNSNTDSSNSSSFKEGIDNKFDTIFEYKTSFPLRKQNDNFNTTLNPLISFKYSPNNSKNMRDDDKRLDINNIFGFNRLGTSTSVEGGSSITYGVEYSKSDKLDNEILGAKIANIFRPEIDKNLPKNNNLGAKTSDIIGEINFNPNDIFKISYDFSLDENISDTNYEMVNAEIKLNKFSTSFEYLNQNNTLVSNSYFSNRTEYKINNTKSFIYEGRENKTTGQVEFYNLIYQYQNDCLKAAIEYNKNYYNDRDFKPEENVFFKLTLIPFGAATSPNIIK